MAIQDRKNDYLSNGYDLTRRVRVAGIIPESVVDGKGIRCTVFVQGCLHDCRGCHNPHTHSLAGGEVMPLCDITAIIENNPLLDGITLSGGEPFLYPAELADLCEWAHESRLNVWCYTGYTFEELLELAQKDGEISRLLDGIDVLIDGRFEEDKKNLLLKFRGSENQRVIDLKKMRETKAGKIIIYPL